MLMKTDIFPEGWRGNPRLTIEVGHILAAKYDELTSKEFYSMAMVELGLDSSAARKLVRIAGNKVFNDPQYVDKLPGEWAKLYELSFLPDAALIKIIEDGSVGNFSKYDIWKLRGDDSRARKRYTYLDRFTARGNQSITNWAMTGIKMEEEGMTGREAAHKIGMGEQTYSMLRCIILSHRDETDPDKKKAIGEAIEAINKDRKIKPVYGRVKPLLNESRFIITSKSLNSPKTMKMRLARLNRLVDIINDTVSMEIDVPPISAEDAAPMFRKIVSARQKLLGINRKIRMAINDGKV